MHLTLRVSPFKSVYCFVGIKGPTFLSDYHDIIKKMGQPWACRLLFPNINDSAFRNDYVHDVVEQLCYTEAAR